MLKKERKLIDIFLNYVCFFRRKGIQVFQITHTFILILLVSQRKGSKFVKFGSSSPVAPKSFPKISSKLTPIKFLHPSISQAAFYHPDSSPPTSQILNNLLQRSHAESFAVLCLTSKRQQDIYGQQIISLVLRNPILNLMKRLCSLLPR